MKTKKTKNKGQRKGKKMEKENKKQTLELTLIVSKEKFTTKDGEIIDYFAFKTNILDQDFRLQVKAEDKRMANYLLRDIFENVEMKNNKGSKKDEEIPF